MVTRHFGLPAELVIEPEHEVIDWSVNFNEPEYEVIAPDKFI